MNILFVILVAVSAAGLAEGLSPGLRMKIEFSTTAIIGESFFFDLPRNVTAAKEAFWTVEEYPSTYLSEYLTMYCYPDKLICCYYDDSEYIAGLQYGILKSNYFNETFDWTVRGFTSWNATVNETSQHFLRIQQYFIDEEALSTNKTQRVAARNSSRLLQYEYVWLTGINGTIDKIPISLEDIIADTLFTEQACVTWMGTHYFYNMSTTTECVSEQMYPWFLLIKNGEIIGTAATNAGQVTVGDGQRNWYEVSGKAFVMNNIPYAPECLYDLASEPGFVTSHIYYVDDPWNIYC